MGGDLLPGHGKQSMVTFNLFTLGIANIFASILMEVIFNPREVG